jgi:hypothetical protein
VRLRGFRPAMWGAEQDAAAAAFLASSPDAPSRLLAYVSSEGVLCLVPGGLPPSLHPAQLCYWLKTDRGLPLTPSNVRTALQFGTLNGGAIASLSRLVSGVYLPAVKGAAAWPESVRNDFAAQIQVSRRVHKQQRAGHDERRRLLGVGATGVRGLTLRSSSRGAPCP